MVFPPQGTAKGTVGKVKLSEVEIDVDKNWAGKKIVNVAEIHIG
jgi:FKBP-type peptidyl-prolyl cis-trans isomerase 2